MSEEPTKDLNMIMLSTHYDYMVLPIDLALLVLQHMTMLRRERETVSSKYIYALSEQNADIELIPTDVVTAARVRAKITA